MSTRHDAVAGDVAVTATQEPSHDFDFLVGRWRVQHRRLRTRLRHDTAWEQFPGTLVAMPLLGGQANVDDNVLELPAGRYRAATLRAFDPASGNWSIWWLDGRSPRHLDPPVVGRFERGVGTFYADDSHEGRPIRVRFVWSGITATRAHWEQAYSDDGGRSWETNWLMDFERSP